MIPISIEWLGVLGLALGYSAQPISQELYDHATLVTAAQALATEHPEQVELFSVARSRAGREVIGIRLSASREIPNGQPAILLVAGLDGPRAYTSSMAMSHAEAIAGGYGKDTAVTELLDSTTLYIVPRFDVDACEARFLTPLAEVQASGRGVDNDRDGLQGEDGPSDVNGDGFVSVMRQLDPTGEWIADPTDPRAMKRADPVKGERGRWKIYTEGLDSDGDELVAEDDELDAIANRNFPRNWTEHSAEAGRYPTDEPCSLGMVEFFLNHPDIALVITYGEEGNLVKKPSTQKDSGAPGGSIETGIYESDLALYEELGRRYALITSSKTEGTREQPGSLQGFAYHHRGLLSLDIDPWSVPLDAKAADEEGEQAGTEVSEAPDETEAAVESKPGDDAKRLTWLDQNTERPFIDWQAFDHPQLGSLEIGGFIPYTLVEPPPETLEELTRSHLEFLLTLGAYLPRLKLIEVEGLPLGGDLMEVSAVLENDALLPQQVHAAERSRKVRPARVTLQLPDGAKLLGGSTQTLVDNLPAAGGRREFRWLVGGVTEDTPLLIEVDTDNAGKISTIVEVR
jgi:hypothetical protein